MAASKALSGLFHLGIAASLLVFLASTLLYCLSLGSNRQSTYNAGPISLLVVSRDYQRGFYLGTTPRGYFHVDGCNNEVFPDVGFRYAGFTVVDNGVGGQMFIAAGWYLPHAILISLPCLFAWLGLTLFEKFTRKKRLLNNLCLACGYDLRASAGACPECGDKPTSLNKSATIRPPRGDAAAT